MRLPLTGSGVVDRNVMQKMVDYFLANGFNYFDTAHGYLGGESEKALKDTLTSKYPRDQYILTNKLSTHFFNKREEILPLFEKQLEACGVSYFDFYLMHAQDERIYEKFKKTGAYEVALGLKKEGKIKHFGISFHDKADVLEKILKENPEIEVVQIQLNYVDYEDPVVESRKVSEVALKYEKPIIVMEPVKGGNLSSLPLDASRVFDRLSPRMSNASYAIRFASSVPGVMMVLSGMSTLDEMKDNVSYMKDFRPLDNKERMAIAKVCKIFEAKHMIPCTSCHYCVLENDCPKKIKIPEIFSCYNKKKIFHNWNDDYYYNNVLVRDGGKASSCLKCGKCEKVCPQHLPIRSLLEDVASEFEK